MMTQTHMLVSATIWKGSSRWSVAAAAVAGGIVPDAAIFALYAIEKFKGTPESTIWGEIYWQPFWQDVVALGNSIPLYLLCVAIGLLVHRITRPTSPTLRLNRWSSVGVVFAFSCLVHVMCDFPVHHHDAHRHFFPLSNYKFMSPVSYWDPHHFGIPFAICESVSGLGLAVVLWKQTRRRLVKLGIGFLALSYLALPVYFIGRLFVA